MKKIILASASPRRKEMLEKLQIPFTVEVSGYKEDMTLKIKPLELAKVLSGGKAEAVAKKHKGEDVIIIGADTFIVFKNKIIGKPRDLKEAEKMIKNFSGKSHSVITGFSIVGANSGKIISRSVESKVYFRKLTDKEIKDYVKVGNPLDKAGGYSVLEYGDILIEKIEGDFLNIEGLPVSLLIEELRKFEAKI